MGTWNTHGMMPNEEDQLEAVRDLALLPEEIDALADYSNRQAYVFGEMRRMKSGQEKRKFTLIHNHWKMRYRQFKRLAALIEQEMEDG
jgi:hypothetical protein